eukprot:CAMPEP_0201136632 /NCGR_PEP_ID=MMETSP0850-20130426/54980_1 /ASSEMBLY_ACC=CAM_ASM_000622 /TAXON_ID=183588 /ORGANISM="Pseudo-nitzschia fraudulenta, Strain WWA7" /LENGTH=737 /DNA_ID=CAMNT_0047407943 /DNA_START=225 /DNA_END=2439 /DNA_ORIENTATION=-
MGLFRRPGKGKSLDDEQQPLKDASGGKKDEPPPKVSADVTEKAQEVMRDNLTVMKEIVMKIRNEEGYAQNMYKDCPRLQNLLNKNPDLRPVFEDPRLVRINFETVYKEAGGILPEDEEDVKKQKKTWMMKIASSKFFKFLKVLMFFKKLISCLTGSGIAAIGGCYTCCTDCCCEDALEAIDEDDGEYELDDMDPYADMDPNAQALNTAADYMEDPDVQEQMQRLLEEPENLEEAIENDVELRNLRDSNELCAELMKEPDTMKILVDPENLRALGEAPKLIELDFADPGGFVPEPDFVDIEAPAVDLLDVDLDVDTPELQTYDANPSDIGDLMDFDPPDAPEVDLEAGVDADVEVEADVEAEPEAEAEADDNAEGEDDDDDGGGGWEDDIELENQDADDGGKDAEAAKKKEKKKKSEAQKAAEAEAAKKGGIAGMAASLGVAGTNVIAAQIVGQVFGDLSLGGGMDGPDLSALENASEMVDDDVMAVAEDTVEDVNEEKKDSKKQKKEDKKDKKKEQMVESLHDASGKRVSGHVTAYGQIKEESDEDDDSFSSFNSADEFADESDSKGSQSVSSEDEKKQKKKMGKSMKKVKKTGKGAFGALKEIAAATMTTAKETVASELLGEDFGEMLVEKQEEMGDDDEKKKKKKKKKDALGGALTTGEALTAEVPLPKGAEALTAEVPLPKGAEKKKKKKDALGGSSHHGGSAHSRGTSSKGGGSSHSRGGSSKDGSSQGGSAV